MTYLHQDAYLEACQAGQLSMKPHSKRKGTRAMVKFVAEDVGIKGAVDAGLFCVNPVAGVINTVVDLATDHSVGSLAEAVIT